MPQGAVVVTGAAGGIGRACAHALAARGETLVLCDLEGDRLDAARDSLAALGRSAYTAPGDLTDPATVAALARSIEELGGLAVLVHAAGLSPTLADARLILDLNLVATARMLEGLRPLAREGSVAVLIASQAAYLIAAAATPEICALLDVPLEADFAERLAALAGPLATGAGGAYALSKLGVQRLAVAEAPAWGARGARIVSVSPGVTDTAMGRSELAGQAAAKVILEKTPVGARLGRPEEIAAVVAFLCSEAASFVSGCDVLVDGGSTQQLLRG